MEISKMDAGRMWKRYCGLVQMPLPQFLDIQRSLLAEQLELVEQRSWFDHLLSDRRALSVEKFRNTVPLRAWGDYLPLLSPESADGVSADAHCWVQTSWCHGSWKRVPWASRFFDAQCGHSIAAIMMSVARSEGDVRIDKNFRVLPFLPDTPFASAWVETGVIQRGLLSTRYADREDESHLPMGQRIQAKLWRTLGNGIDSVVGMASTLVMVRREFERMMETAGFRQLLSRGGGRAAGRWALSKARSLRWMDPWEPKSLLAPKSIITWGADTTFLTPALEAAWGAPVLELYASSEGGIMAMQDWRRRGLVPLATSVFLEFLPAGAAPEPGATLLLDQLQEGSLYEPVITSFYGMPYLRLRQGDLLKVVGRNEEGMPLFAFHSRADDIIDLGSIARIDRATLKEALQEVGVGDGRWQARKEYVDGRPMMCLYVDVEQSSTEELRRQLHRALGKIDPHYREAGFVMGYRLLRVSPAPSGLAPN